MTDNKRNTRQNSSKTVQNDHLEDKVMLLEQNMMANVNELKNLITSRNSGSSAAPRELTNDDLLRKITSFQESIQSAINSIRKELEDLKVKVTSFEGNHQDRQRQLNGFVISGLAEDSENDTEKVRKQVVEVINKKIGFSINEDDINCCYRLGIKNGNRAKPRPTAVLFVNKWKRDIVFSKKRMLKGSGVVFTEILSREKQNLYKSACDKYGVKNCWSWKGEIYVSEGGNKKQVKNSDDV